jgi:uncharacterized protein (DUF433 family)
MTNAFVAEQIALELTQDGVMRVGGTRVTLDTVIAAFDEGATAEEIVQQYPSLELADVYSVIGYYLRHRQLVEDYMNTRQQAQSETRAVCEAHSTSVGLRARLLARRASAGHRYTLRIKDGWGRQ